MGSGQDPYSGAVGDLGDGKGQFASRIYLDVKLGARLIATDLDGDGHVDLAGAAAGDSIGVVRGDGRGGFFVPTYYLVIRAGSLTAGDLDGDGRLDLVTGGSILFNR
jgi:hypothetical protein